MTFRLEVLVVTMQLDLPVGGGVGWAVGGAVEGAVGVKVVS